VVRRLCAADSFASKMHTWGILGSLARPLKPAVQGAQDGLKSATFVATTRRHLFLRVAGRCRIGIDKPFLLTVAHGFCVLRPEWCQQWCQMASATPYPDGSNRTEGGPCQYDLRPAQGFILILVYAQVFGVGFHVFMVPYGSNLLQHTVVPLPNSR
jgi:hypothetical protein